MEVEVEFDFGRVRAIPVPATSADVTVIKGRAKLCGWSLYEASTNGQAGTPVTATVAIVAAAAGSVSLPLAKDSITGFDVTMAAPAAGVTGVVTLTNVVGGPVVYQFSAGPSRENSLQVRFPQPLPSSGGAVNVAISAIVGGGAVDITVYGVAPATGAYAQINDGGQILGESAMAPGLSDSQYLGDHGIDIMNEIVLHVISGTIEGVIYARYRD